MTLIWVYFSVQLAPSLLASFHQKYSIQNSIDTQRMRYMQGRDPGPAKILHKPEKGDTQKMPQPRMKRPVAEHPTNLGQSTVQYYYYLSMLQIFLFFANSAAVFSCLFVFFVRSDLHQPRFCAKISTRPRPPGEYKTRLLTGKTQSHLQQFVIPFAANSEKP